MPDSKIPRLSNILDAPLARLEQSREELSKAWLLRIVERTSLEEIERIPTDRIARELPELIAEIVRLIGEDGKQPTLDPGSEHYRRATQLVALRGLEEPAPAELSLDIAALQSVMIAALRRELNDVDPRLVVDAVERLTTVFGGIQAAAVEELLHHRSRELEWLANTDALTGLYNFRYLQQHIRHLVGVEKRYGHPFAVLLLDIDGLKRINDSFGHAAGDRTLMAVAEAVRGAVRTIDIPTRMGGDEFCVLAPDQTASRAKALGERLAAAVEAVDFPDGTGVGISIGVVSCPQHSCEPERLLELADGAMYRAKAAGECVAVGVPDTATSPELEGARPEQNGA